MGAAAAVGFPTIAPAKVPGQLAPSKRINVGAIGVGLISRVNDMPGILQLDRARIVAVCDLDAHRVEDGKKFVNDFFTAKTGKFEEGVTGYANYHELLANKDIDAVVVSTPDHWHALIGIDAVRAGKDVYLQKPVSLTIAEGRALSNAVQACGRILQIGSQQRSTVQFRYAAELVRNGRIGDLQRVEVGLPGDPPGGDKSPIPVPDWFNCEMWLGETPYVYYTLDRVHPHTG
jgi:predicted dehydrogenase